MGDVILVLVMLLGVATWIYHRVCYNRASKVILEGTAETTNIGSSEMPNENNRASKDILEDAAETTNNGSPGMSDESSHRPMDIVYGALQTIGCQPQKSQDRWIEVAYQGEHFKFEFDKSDEARFVRIWSPAWCGVNVNDPRIGLFRESVNMVNYNYGPTVVMTPPNENNEIVLHSRFDIMVPPALRDVDRYIRATLDSFFVSRNELGRCFNTLQAQQLEKRRNRRPIGFSTPQ